MRVPDTSLVNYVQPMTCIIANLVLNFQYPPLHLSRNKFKTELNNEQYKNLPPAAASSPFVES